METTTTYTHDDPQPVPAQPSNPAVMALAVVGFVALVVLGIMLAIYSSRYVPEAISKLTPPLSSLPTPASLGVVTSSTTPTSIPFGGSSADEMAAAGPGYTTASPSYYSPSSSNSYGAPVTSAPITSAPVQPTYYGLPNLTTTIIATGYLANGTTASFVPAQVVPEGARAAIQFSIANNGTNVTGPWSFDAVIPTRGAYVFQSPIEQPLGPGDHIVFTLGFDQANLGPNDPITVTADPQNMVQESTKADNSATAIFSVAPTGPAPVPAYPAYAGGAYPYAGD